MPTNTSSPAEDRPAHHVADPANRPIVAAADASPSPAAVSLAYGVRGSGSTPTWRRNFDDTATCPRWHSSWTTASKWVRRRLVGDHDDGAAGQYGSMAERPATTVGFVE